LGVQPNAVRPAGPLVVAHGTDRATAVVAQVPAEAFGDVARVARGGLGGGGTVARTRFGFFIRPSVQTRMTVG